MYDLVRVGVDMNFMFFSFDSRLICRWVVWWFDYDQTCEYDTLDSDAYGFYVFDSETSLIYLSMLIHYHFRIGTISDVNETIIRFES